MNGGDKILDRIKADCDASINETAAKTAEICSQIKSEGKAEAEKASLEIALKTDAKIKQLNASAKSRAELEIRNALLKRRRSEIDITLKKILEYLLNLGDKDYFEIIYKLASKLSGKSGEILLNEKDIKRLPKDFENRLSQCGVKASVSSVPADISGGFILRCGDIEENMDFSALINEKSGELEDLISRELFSE